jgi:predicted RNA-binding protein with EMAP domain
MTTPNLLNLTSIIPKTSVQTITTTATAIVTNSESSNKVFKIGALYISNVGTGNQEVTVDVVRDSVAYRIAKAIVVPASATLDVISKSIYLEEGDVLRLTADEDSTLEAVCSYEEIA